MDDLLIGILTTFGLGWVAWVSLTIIKNYNNKDDYNDLKESFKEMEDRFVKEIDKVNLRQDNFIKAEIQELKNIVKG